MATTHYLEALDFQKEIVKIQTIFGGKNPHPNWLVGGVPCSINVDGTGAVGAINMVQLNMVGDIINRTIEFIDQVYIPDLLAIASFYKDWAKIGGGLSGTERDVLRRVPGHRRTTTRTRACCCPSGVILGGDLKKVYDVDLKAADQVQEWVTHSWYKQGDENKGLHPVRRRHRPELRARPEDQGHAHQHRERRRGRQVLVGEVAALEGQPGRGRPARALHRRLRARQQGDQGAGRTWC